MYSADLKAVGAHEDVHVIAQERIGSTDYTLLGEGLAVWADQEWWGEPLEHWVVTYRNHGSLPTLDTLIDEFWSLDSGITYPVAGHFMGFLADDYGVDAVKRIDVADDVRVAFEDEIGIPIAELETAWLASVP